MNFNYHPNLQGKHALLSPSQYHWVNYTDQKLEAKYYSQRSAAKGTMLHEFARRAIELRVKLSSSNKTLSRYVNDAISYKMTCEQTLYYSDNCFGSADAISFRRGVLRIHDLKTGINPSSEHQLEIYAALFCLEYNVNPFDIKIELRIYQNDEARIFDADPEVIETIMGKIVEFDMRIEFMKERDLSANK